MAGTVAQSTPSAATEASKDRFILVRTVVLLGCDRPSTGSRKPLRNHGQGMGTPDRPCTRDAPQRQDASLHHPLPRCPRHPHHPRPPRHLHCPPRRKNRSRRLRQQPRSLPRPPPRQHLPRHPTTRKHPQCHRHQQPPPRHPCPQRHSRRQSRPSPHRCRWQDSDPGQLEQRTCLPCSYSKGTRRPLYMNRQAVARSRTRSRHSPPASPGADPTAPARPPQHESSW